MQFDQLKYLTELHRTQCMTKAAENLYVTQPAISKSLNNLERELGIKLFIGTRSGVAFTIAGEKIARQSQNILNQIKSLEINILNYEKIDNDKVKGTLKIAGMPLLFQPIMSNIVKNFKTYHPNVVLDISQLLVKQLFSAFNPDNFDVALVVWEDMMLSSHPQIEKLERHPICDVSLCIAMRAKHPLHTKKIIQIDDVTKFPWISGNFNDIAVFLQGLASNVTLVTDDIDLAFENLLEKDYLFATTNLSEKHPYVTTGEILIRPLDCNLSLKFGCLYFKNSTKKELIDLFIERVKNPN
jgi:LysR family transcriptional regulator, transcription activator of glutamate synthase operon